MPVSPDRITAFYFPHQLLQPFPSHLPLWDPHTCLLSFLPCVCVPQISFSSPCPYTCWRQVKISLVNSSSLCMPAMTSFSPHTHAWRADLPSKVGSQFEDLLSSARHLFVPCLEVVWFLYVCVCNVCLFMCLFAPGGKQLPFLVFHRACHLPPFCLSSWKKPIGDSLALLPLSLYLLLSTHTTYLFMAIICPI